MVGHFCKHLLQKHETLPFIRVNVEALFIGKQNLQQHGKILVLKYLPESILKSQSLRVVLQKQANLNPLCWQSNLNVGSERKTNIFVT